MESLSNSSTFSLSVKKEISENHSRDRNIFLGSNIAGLSYSNLPRSSLPTLPTPFLTTIEMKNYTSDEFLASYTAIPDTWAQLDPEELQ